MKGTAGIFTWQINIQRRHSASIRIISPTVVTPFPCFCFFFLKMNYVCAERRNEKLYVLQVMHLSGEKRKSSAWQDFQPSVLLAGTNTHAQSCHIIQHAGPWDLSFPSNLNTAE